jgi:hypothetical protein
MILSSRTNDSKRSAAVDTGAVFVNIDATLNEILIVTNIEI